MELILLQDVVNVGKEGDVVKVRDGHGRNFLMPQNLAVLATPDALKTNKARAAKRQAAEEKIKKEMEALGQKIGASSLVIKADVGEEGKLFGSVTTTEIAKEIKAQLGIDVDRRKVHMDNPIKVAGEHKIKIKLYPEIHPVLTVTVKAK
jgi:large subunit ribosomal protein L9